MKVCNDLMVGKYCKVGEKDLVELSVMYATRIEDLYIIYKNEQC